MRSVVRRSGTVASRVSAVTGSIFAQLTKALGGGCVKRRDLTLERGGFRVAILRLRVTPGGD